ncbi:alpha/beta fold hydrolase [Pseudomonas sp. TE3610]
MNTGEQTPVIFINGLIGTLKSQLNEQAYSGRPMAAPDLLGYGCEAARQAGVIDIATQVEHLEQKIAQQFGERKVHLVGHSVGGVVAYLFALRYPERVLGVVSVEGNFSLKDAFWSSSVARAPAHEVVDMLAGYRAQPDTWLTKAGLAPEAPLLERAQVWLAHQPADTLQAMAKSVVAITGAPDYPEQLQRLFEGTPVHLLAGGRSVAGWDIPGWARSASHGLTLLADRGHLMMLEDPAGFAQCLAAILVQLDHQTARTWGSGL